MIETYFVFALFILTAGAVPLVTIRASAPARQLAEARRRAEIERRRQDRRRAR